MRRIIAIIDPDPGYARKLAEYINKSDFGGLKAVTFSNADSYKSLINNYDTRMMLINETEITSIRDETSAENANISSRVESTIMICLSEDNFAFTHYATINKYSGADKIVRFMLEKYSEVTKDVMNRTAVSRSHVITVYSPVGRCGKTTFAITIAQYLGSAGKCLLLSLDEFSGVFKYISEDAQSDLSDVIYVYKQGKYTWAKLAESVCHFGKMDYIAPARYPEDLTMLTGEEMAGLLDRIAMEGGYEDIVLDVGSYGKRAMEILEISNELYIPTQNSGLSKCKIEEFKHTLDESGRAELISRMKEVELPFEERMGEPLAREEEYGYGKLFEYTRNLFSDQGQSDKTAD